MCSLLRRIEEADPLKEQMLEQMMKSREEEFTDTVDIMYAVGVGRDVFIDLICSRAACSRA